MDLSEKIKSEINENSIILYMKGTKDMPMCGFSNQVVQILNHYNVDFKDIEIRFLENIIIDADSL